VFLTDVSPVSFRRGWTHGLPAQVLLPLAVALLFWLVGRFRSVRDERDPPLHVGWLVLLSGIGVYSHVLLDLLNTYGVRLLAPLEWNEPFGLILIEALLSGCPVVGFGRGSLPELVEHGVTGFLAASENDMVELIRPGGPVDTLDRRRIREIATRRFDRPRMVADYERVYQAAAARVRRASLRPITAA
jgi:glycosyltransferase involved in cell wall biosynthesis